MQEEGSVSDWNWVYYNLEIKSSVEYLQITTARVSNEVNSLKKSKLRDDFISSFDRDLQFFFFNMQQDLHKVHLLE